jgi:hypothetical protein
MNQKNYLTQMVSQAAIVDKKDAILQHRLKNQIRLQESRLDKLMILQDKMKQDILSLNSKGCETNS